MQAWSRAFGFARGSGQRLRDVETHRNHGQAKSYAESHRIHQRIAEAVEGVAHIGERGNGEDGGRQEP